MKRILLLGLVAASFTLVAPAGVQAAAPCRDKIYNEWYSTGKISTDYPESCYRDALKNIPPDARIYSNLSSDIKAALQAAISRKDHGGSGPSAVGSGPGAGSGPQGVKGKSATTRGGGSGPTAIAPLSSTKGGGVPTPILVLGAIAILLALAGLAGTGVQQVRKRRAA